ncbi:MAG TPA: dienelactone hydrolase family protein [Nevskia sp.]|jgi:carboxymethylenebutenolidase|nr:dienelactone hydrolase family protein [Nevskia sp.]
MTDQALIRIDDALSGYYAQASAPRAPGVVVLMEAYGLTMHIRRVCDRLAAAGFHALAPDLYHGQQFSYASMDQAIAMLRSLDDARLMDEIGASLDWLGRQPEVDRARLAAQGYCMGGRLAFLAGCRHPGKLRAVVSHYGSAIHPEGDKDRLGRTPPIAEAAALAAPLLLIYGGADTSIPPAEHARLAQRLGELQKRYVLSVYPGAAHGFCCEDRAAYAPEAAEAAHAEAVDFLRRVLP